MADDTSVILSAEYDKNPQPSAGNNRTIRSAVKTKYRKTKANLKSVGTRTLPERKDRNDYEDLDKSKPSHVDPNVVIRSTEHIESTLKKDACTANDVFDKFEGRRDIRSQSKSVIHSGDNQSCMSVNISQSTSRSNDKICETVIIGQRNDKNRRNVWFLFYTFFFSMYLIIGSLCFQGIETPAEREATSNVLKKKNEFLQKYPLIYEDDLEAFLKAVIDANNRGISALRNASNDMNWNFGQALFFSSTVITTIGYGHVTPLSQTGKIFCMIYATIGIPLTLVLLNGFVERLLVPANWLLGILNAKLGHLYQPFNIRLLHLSIIIALIAVIFFAIPTTIFAYLESEWSVLDAFYYCFISLTTIGLGDFIPGEGISPDNRSLYKIGISIYLVCGLIAMLFALTVFYDIPQLNLGQLFTENVNGETEKLRLSGNNTTCYSGPSGLYMPQRDEEVRRAVVRIRPHGDDSPSPDDPPSSMNRDMRIP